MGWRLREGESEIATGRVAPDYGPNSEYFTIRLHHSGQLCEFGRRVYVGGKIDRFDYCHVDEMSLIELTEMAKILQIDTKYVTFFYSRNDHGHGHGTPSEGDSSRRLPDIEEGLEYMGDDIEGDMNKGEERQRVAKSEAQNGLVDSELGNGDNESDFGIEVNWGGVEGKGKSSQSMKSNKGKGKEVDKHGGFAVFNSNLDNDDPQFEVGLCFPDTQSFRDAVRQHSIINARDVVVTKNDKNKVQVKYKHDTCKWYIFASKIHGEDTMQVKHCTMNINALGLRECLQQTLNDKQKSLIDDVDMLLPYCEHRFCVMHLYNNFKVAHKGLGLKMMLWKAAKATRVVDFEKIMNELREKDLEAFKWLAKRPAAQWSRSYFGCNAKCDILLNNMCESFNATIVEARSRPIVDMLQTIRMMLMKRVYVKRDQIKKHKGKLTTNIQKLIEELKKKSMEYIAHWNGKDQFEVESCYGDKHNLHLGEKTCSCRKWQLTGIPCAHAISGMYFMGYKPEDYVHEYYHKSNFLRVYNYLMMPLLGPEE
ncbi:hypothetical protein Sango_2286900 [Sesamum angolense]|uniref:SWIM-type domain-containing protein n=1 Tax=Sesamum angolense TaxID=2727404 RepID=A0AAE1W9Z3_9LAMI|nr:hypothetical protein Sango_2286900 [Sesamum angolense]